MTTAGVSVASGVWVAAAVADGPAFFPQAVKAVSSIITDRISATERFISFTSFSKCLEPIYIILPGQPVVNRVKKC
jgi:hypothetical protein